MENKYYKPAIDEFHVGFEFEFDNSREWGIILLDSSHNLEDIESDISKGCIRVKYLNDDDFDNTWTNLGVWYHEKQPSNELGYWTRVTVRLWHDHKVLIRGHRGSEEDKLFDGVIRNKSELNRILKQLKID